MLPSLQDYQVRRGPLDRRSMFAGAAWNKLDVDPRALVTRTAHATGAKGLDLDALGVSGPSPCWIGRHVVKCRPLAFDDVGGHIGPVHEAPCPLHHRDLLLARWADSATGLRFSTSAEGPGSPIPRHWRPPLNRSAIAGLGASGLFGGLVMSRKSPDRKSNRHQVDDWK